MNIYRLASVRVDAGKCVLMNRKNIDTVACLALPCFARCELWSLCTTASVTRGGQFVNLDAKKYYAKFISVKIL